MGGGGKTGQGCLTVEWGGKWKECTDVGESRMAQTRFLSRINVAIHLLFQRKFTHREVTDEPMVLLLIYPETTQFHGSLLQWSLPSPTPPPNLFPQLEELCVKLNLENIANLL